MRRALGIAAIVAFLAFLLPMAPGAAAATIGATVQGPQALAPSQTAQYNVTITGWPSELPANFTVTYYITGANVSGGAPLQTSPSHVTGNTTRLRLNVTAPSAEETITLVIQAVAQPRTGSSANATTEFPITVIKPVLLTVTFHNDSTTAALNVSVRFYVDNAFVGSTKVARFAPLADTTVTFNYLPVGLSDGSHTVRAEADLNGDGVLEASLGEVATSTLFYHGVSPPAAGWSYLLGVGVFVAVLLAVLVVRRRGQR